MVIQEYEVCLSIQRALLDAVTNSLRRVSFTLKNNLIIMYFVFDNEPSEIEKELMGDISAEVISDFPDDYKIDCELLHVAYPKKIHSQGRIVFSRYEPSMKGNAPDTCH